MERSLDGYLMSKIKSLTISIWPKNVCDYFQITMLGEPFVFFYQGKPKRGYKIKDKLYLVGENDSKPKPAKRKKRA